MYKETTISRKSGECAIIEIGLLKLDGSFTKNPFECKPSSRYTESVIVSSFPRVMFTFSKKRSGRNNGESNP